MIAPVPAPWFAKRIRRGLAALVALRLEGHPAADMVEATAQVWVQALWPGRVWEEAADSGRIGETFRQITLHETRWPAPAVFLRYLPARAPLAALPAPKLSAAEKEANKARLQKMLDELAGRFEMDNPHVRASRCASSNKGAMNRAPTHPGTQGDTDTTGG